MKVVAKKINNPNCYYLTEGKAYDVIRYSKDGFVIKDDKGLFLTMAFRNSDIIKADWTIIGNRAVVAEES